MNAAASPQPAAPLRDERIGLLLVFLSALLWSFGGAIDRFIQTPDDWAVVFWRASWASVFLIGFMLMRDGARGTLALFRGMGVPGIAVGTCFAVASSSFVIAIAHTTVANVVLMQAGVPLIATLMAFLFFGERVGPATWVAMTVMRTMAPMISPTASSWPKSATMPPRLAGMAGITGLSSGNSTRVKASAKLNRSRTGIICSPRAGISIMMAPMRANRMI